jgi:hypothetical protein
MIKKKTDKKPKDQMCWSFTFKHKKLKVLQIYDPIFCVNWIACVTKKYSDFKEMADSSYGVELKKAPVWAQGNCGYCLENNGNTLVFIWLSEFNYPKFSHEILHGVGVVLNDKGIGLSGATDEIFAYYQEFIMKQLNKLKRR